MRTRVVLLFVIGIFLIACSKTPDYSAVDFETPTTTPTTTRVDPTTTTSTTFDVRPMQLRTWWHEAYQKMALFSPATELDNFDPDNRAHAYRKLCSDDVMYAENALQPSVINAPTTELGFGVGRWRGMVESFFESCAADDMGGMAKMYAQLQEFEPVLMKVVQNYATTVSVFDLDTSLITTARIPSPSALCNDGTYSYSAHHQGTCSYHDGVQQFFR
jgi:hypothetical protein